MKKLLATSLVIVATIPCVHAIDKFGYGIDLKKDESSLTINNIMPNSVAEKTGLKAGQKIIKLNGKKIDKITNSDIEHIDNTKPIKLVSSNATNTNLYKTKIKLNTVIFSSDTGLVFSDEYGRHFNYKDYQPKEYKKQLKYLDTVLKTTPNAVNLYLERSLIYNAQGNIDNAINSVNLAVNIVEAEGYTPNSYATPEDMKFVYLYRAYLYLKTGQEQNLTLIYKDIDNFFTLNKRHSAYLICNLYMRRLIYELLNDISTPPIMKINTYKYLIKKVVPTKKYGTRFAVPLIASYIEYVYSLDDSDPVFIKLGKNKKEILNLYITTLRGKYADIIKGIYYIASGQYETGVKMTYNSFCALINKYSSSFDVSKEDINDAYGIICGALSLLQKFDIYYIQLPNAVKINDIGIKTLWEMRTGSWRFYH